MTREEMLAHIDSNGAVVVTRQDVEKAFEIELPVGEDLPLQISNTKFLICMDVGDMILLVKGDSRLTTTRIENFADNFLTFVDMGYRNVDGDFRNELINNEHEGLKVYDNKNCSPELLCFRVKGRFFLYIHDVLQVYEMFPDASFNPKNSYLCRPAVKEVPNE